MAKLLVDAGLVVMMAFISPYKKDRNKVRELLDDEEFLEVFVDASLKTCEERDPKGMYKKARAGEIKNFTGISAPYEIPENPELVLNTTEEADVNANAEKVLKYLELRNIF